MDLKTQLDIGKYLKDNLKNIVALATLLISLGVFVYSIYLFYSVAIQNKDLSDEMLINTKKEVKLEDDVIKKLEAYRQKKPNNDFKLDRLDDPFQ